MNPNLFKNKVTYKLFTYKLDTHTHTHTDTHTHTHTHTHIHVRARGYAHVTWY